jgi:transglutaminase-like putative cysteine protease
MNSTIPTKNALLWLMLGLSLAALPHFSYQPLWVFVVFASMLGWRCMAIWHAWDLPSKQHRRMKWLHHSIAILATVLLLTSYGNLIGRDAGVALLTVMLGLKVVEIRSSRDYYLSCFLGYFLVVTNFFYSQSIPNAALMFLVVTILTTCLISLNDAKQALNGRSQFKLASHMLLQAIPLMLLLFVLFPRISGPLWGLPTDAHSAKTGIDNNMTLGKISQLIQSDEIAFRVEFNGQQPAQSELYWRGPVLWHSDGVTWTELHNETKAASQPNIVTVGTAYNYTATVEAHNAHWLFALDLPNALPVGIKANFTQDGQLLSNDRLRQRQQYQLSAHTQYRFNEDNDRYLADALQLPKNQHPRTQQLAQQWLQQTQLPLELVQLALTYFNQQDFYYTLSPPQLAGDTIDNFLFESRRGFCEHYAASFTILMRAAGVPTRIVTGYQGGEINPVDDFLVIRQRDAHAWTEVWVKGQGWVRVDPTAAVAKHRIDQGMNTIMPLNMRSPLLLSNSRQLAELWQTLRNNWDALDNSWNQWILAYGPELQKEFLSKLGMPSPNWQQMVIWLSVSLSIVLLLISILIFYQRKRLAPVVFLYQKFCSKVAVNRKASEGPIDFADRVKQLYPNNSAEIDRINQLYINLHYGNKSASMDDLKQAIKAFKPPRI